MAENKNKKTGKANAKNKNSKKNKKATTVTETNIVTEGNVVLSLIVTWIDPEGKPELKLANKYKELASKVEDIGYSRFAETLREISNKYVEEAAYNIKNYNAE